MKQYDAVVIGAGNAGLVAATRLQRGGLRTLLLERHNIPGGCATSFVRGDFEFEVALHQLSGVGSEEDPFVIRKMFEDLDVLRRLELVQEHELYRLIIPGQFDIVLPADWEGMRNRLIEFFPAEADAIGRFFALGEAVAKEYYMVLPRARMSNNVERLRASCPNFVAHGLRPARAVLEEFFRDEFLISAITPYWSYVGIPTNELPFAELIGMLYMYCVYKPWHFKGGSQSLSNALIASFEEAGGEARFNCGAEKILTEAGRVRAVRLETGEVVGTDIVVSNASPLITYNELLDLERPPESVREDFKSRRMGLSAVCLYLGLDATPEELGITTASTFVISTLDKEIREERLYTLDAPEWGMVTCYNFIDDELAPPGKSVVTLVALQYGQAWDHVAPEDYAATKYRFGDELIALVEKAYPKIRAHIEKAEVATPLTMMRYLNTPGGAIYGFKQTIQDTHLMRGPLDAIEGLYSSSSWTGMGGFQPTYMNGYFTAKQILKKQKNAKKERSHVR